MKTISRDSEHTNIYIPILNHWNNSIEALSDALRNWGDKDGAVIIVSHDKAFCDTIDFTHVGTVMEGRLTVEERGLTTQDWDIYNLEADVGAASASDDISNAGNVVNGKDFGTQNDFKNDKKMRTDQKNLMKKLEREIEKIDLEIQKLKSKKDAIQAEIDLSSDKGWSVLADLTDKLNNISEEIDSKEARWLELSEQIDPLKFS